MLTEPRLRQDLQAAMKGRETVAVSVLRGLLAAIANLRIDKGVPELAEGDILGVLQRETKKREEAERFARQAGREELVRQNSEERAVLARYLPRPLDDAELTALLRGWMAEGVRAIGPLMARLKERHAGRYDGKRASEIARSLLAAG